MAFSAKVKRYVGETASLDSESVGLALLQGVDYSLGMLKQMSPGNIPQFAHKILLSEALADGYVSGLVLTNSGSSYETGVTIVFSHGNARAEVSVSQANGAVLTGLSLVYGGSGYTTAPTAVVVDKAGGNGSGAVLAVTAILKDGFNLKRHNVFDIVRVERGKYFAQPVSDDQKFRLKDEKSLYYAQNGSPAYSVDAQGILRVYPDTASATADNGALYVVIAAGGKTINDVDETIIDDAITFGGNESLAEENFPQLWKELVVLHASELLLVEKLSDFSSSLPTDLNDTTVFDTIADVEITVTGLTKSLPSNFNLSTSLPTPTVVSFPSSDVQDVLDKAKSLFDKTADIGGDGSLLSVQQWLEDEDEDMVTATLNSIGVELNRATSIIGEHQAQVQSLANDFTMAVTKYTTEISKEAQRVQIDISEYQAELSNALQQKQNELQEYSTNLGKKMNSYTTLIQKINTDYQWVTTQLQLIGAKKQEFMQSISATGASDNPKEGAV